MKNKKKVPVLTEGPDKSIIFFHGDLDGTNGLQVCYKWLEENLSDNHDIEFRSATYENINEMCEGYFEIADQYRYIMLVDISIHEDLALKAPENCYIFDHHDTSDYLDGMCDRYYHDSRWCGAVVAWKALFKRKPSKPFQRLMKLCNDYDLWKGPNDEPVQEGHDLNLLVNKYGFNDFMRRFIDGFTGFNREETEYIKTYWETQQDIWENKTEKVAYGDDVLLLLPDPEMRFDGNWWCNRMLKDEGFNVVLVLYADRNRLSVRVSSRISWFHAGEWLIENISNTNNSKGGHEKAGGCSTEGLTVEDILNLGIMIQELFDERKENVA